MFRLSTILRTVILALALFCPFLLFGQGKAVQVSSSDREIIIDYYPSRYNPQSVSVNGQSHFYFPESELTSKAGEPGLPTESFLIGIPSSGDVKIEMIEEQLSEPGAGRIAAVPTLSVSSDSLHRIERKFTESASSGSRSIEAVRVDEVFWWRYQRISRISVRPISFNPSNQTFRNRGRMRFKVSFTGPSDSPHLAPPETPRTEELYKSILLNYEQARPWRSPAASSAQTALDSTGTWFTPGQEFVKIPIARDGMYRLTYNDLLAAGAVPTSLNLQNADLYYGGQSISFGVTGDVNGIFGSGDTIEFYGSRLFDSPRILNEFSDTSVYWLTFSGLGGKRTIDTVVNLTPQDTATYFMSTYRTEKDSFYFFGNGGLPTNNQPAKVFGEGWYWKRLLANQTAIVPWTSLYFHKTGNPSYTVRGRLLSPVNNNPPAAPEHSITVRVNGTSIGTVLFDDNRDTVFALTASSSLFVEGSNTVSLQSNPTSAPLNEVFLDWIEIECLKSLTADSDTLEFSADHLTPGGIGLFEVGGFSNADIQVYRIGPFGDLERLFRGIISGSSPFSISFTDTVQAGKKYLAVTGAKKIVPPLFRSKTFGNLRSPGLGADYLVITSRELLPAANQLVSYRSQRGIGRTAVVTAEDIYDEFNYGFFNPYSLRSFLLAADTLWAAPQPSMVVFFGDANWDYKNVLNTSRRNHVPSLGNPVSDSWLVASPTDLFLPRKEAGRIPASTVNQGLEFVSALSQYESQQLSGWNKRYMFMVSGFDSAETAVFAQFSETMISQNITPPPLAGVSSRLYRKVQVAGTTESEEVRRILREGAVWINFYGHAGTDAWGNGLTEAEDLINDDGKRHIVTDVSCSTVRFAEPLIESFAEKLLFASEGGAMAYIGGSGFGYESPLRFMASRFYHDAAKDTVREIGSLLLKAKLALHALGTGSIINQEALQLMTLVGDPATRIAIATRPDYHVNSDEIAVEPAQPSEADSELSIRILLRNFGLQGTDSVLTRVTHAVENDPPEVFDFLRPGIGGVDTLTVEQASFLRAGFHTLSVAIDPAGMVPEENEANNIAQVTFFVGAGQLQILAPPAFSSIHPDSVLLTIINPNNPQTGSWKVVFEVDTTDSFGSPALLRNELAQPGLVTSSWQIPAGVLRDSSVYFWRVRLKGAADSTEWREGIFVTNRSLRKRWSQDRSRLFAENSSDQLELSSLPRLRQLRLSAEIVSSGFSDGSEARIILNGSNISQGFSNRGYNIAVINQNSGALETYAAFSIYSDVTDTTLAEPLIQFLQGIPYGRRVLIAVADEGSKNKTEQLNVELESFGSSMIRLLGFRGSWAMSGWKGAPVGSVPEVITSSGSGSAIVLDTLDAKSVKGSMLSPTIGPASIWNDVAISADTSAGITRVYADILRTMDDGSRDTILRLPIVSDSLMAFLTANVATVQLRALLESDSAGLSPILNSWSVDFTPAAELALSYQTTDIPIDSVDEGDQLSIHVNLHNVGFSSADSVALAAGVFVGNQLTLFSQRIIPSISPGSAASETIPFNTTGFRGRIAFLVQANANARIRESITANNAMSLSAFAFRDTVAPAFDVVFDGSRIVDGDYVNPTPEISISIRDNSPLPITNPGNVDVRLDQRRITLGSDPDSLFEIGSGGEKARVLYRPVLSNGPHTLSVQVLDATGNPADSMALEIQFQVENRARLMNVVNIPNPFASETVFTFHLSGPSQPEEGKLRIYAVSGRLLYERMLYPGEVKLGFNRIVWNGRDRDGDEIANGVYFYKISVQLGDKSVEAIEKLAKLR
ncbi:MAG TPA: C25 family cysteine peptidase [Bacteroidota bacterium]|nr:C25 family cysteine peptidase [Bacteroidota bacterium]